MATAESRLRGGNEAADFGLFDMGARAQSDLFDDVTSREAQDAARIITDDLRTLSETDDFEVNLGAGDKKLSAYLDDLDKDDEIVAVVDACLGGKA